MGISLKRLESQALRELSIILNRKSKNDYLKRMTITSVKLTNDLSFMTVYYTFYSGKLENYIDAIESSKSFLRSELAKSLNARKTPELIFKYDESLAYGNHIEELIHQYHEKHDEADAKNNIEEN